MNSQKAKGMNGFILKNDRVLKPSQILEKQFS
jgi:hypothetical protein